MIKLTADSSARFAHVNARSSCKCDLLSVLFMFVSLVAPACNLDSKKTDAMKIDKQQASAQNTKMAREEEPHLGEKISAPSIVEAFKPAGWHVLAVAQGDLNGDRIPDEAAIFCKDRPDVSKREQSSDVLETPRLLVIALRSDEEYQIVFKSEKIVLTRSLGVMLEEPVESLRIEKGTVSITQQSLGTQSSEYDFEIWERDKQWWIEGTAKVHVRRSGQTRKIKLDPRPATEFDLLRWLDGTEMLKASS